MKTTIKYYRKSVYGNILNYLVTRDNPQAQALQWLINTKTISDDQMERARELDIKFERVFED